MVDIKKWQDRIENLLQVQKDLCLEQISTTFTRNELIELRLLFNEMIEIANRATAVTVAESEEDMKTITVANNMIYSESLGEMIIKGFYMKKKNGEYRHYTWNDKDCVYWADDVDNRFYYEVPQNAILTLK